MEQVPTPRARTGARIAATHPIWEFGGATAPVASLAVGDEVTLEVRDGGDGLFDEYPSGPSGLSVGSIPWSRMLPLTGPISVDGARSGDTLVVEIRDIAIASRAWTAFAPKLSRLMLSDELAAPAGIHVSSIEEHEVVFDDRVRLSADPMIGCIGVAPAGPPAPARTPGLHGGNMDARIIGKGSRLYLPVAHDGALLALGDLHATMGDGEVGGSGAECAGEVTIACDLIRDQQADAPLVETDQAWYVVASGWSMEDATRRTLRIGLAILQSALDITVDAASMLASIGCHLEVCQIVNPAITMRLRLPKALLGDASPWLTDRSTRLEQ